MDYTGARLLAPPFLVDLASKLGGTKLHACVDVSVVPPIPFACKLISSEEAPVFLTTQGAVLRAIASHPHPGLPCIQRTVEILEVPSLGAGRIRAMLIMPPLYGDLASYIRFVAPRGLPEESARSLVAQLLAAVAHAHALGIALRELRLGKIMFTDSDRQRIAVADVAGTQLLECEDGLVDDHLGSPAYAAPEVFSPAPFAARPADVWSVGVIATVLLTGRFPFQAPTYVDVSQPPLPPPRAPSQREQTRDDNDCFVALLIQPPACCSLIPVWLVVLSRCRPAGIRAKVQRATPVLSPSLSAPARSLLHRLLCPDVASRSTAAAALHDPWIVGHNVPAQAEIGNTPFPC